MKINITANGSRTTRVSLGSSTTDYVPNAHALDTFADTAAMVRAISDKRYGREAAYTAEVQRKVANMGGLAEVADAGAVDGQYRVLTPDQQVEREALAQQQIGVSDHDRAMIAKFEAATARGREGA